MFLVCFYYCKCCQETGQVNSSQHIFRGPQDFDNLIISLCRGISALAHSQVLEEAVFTYTLRQLNRCYYIQIQNFPFQRSACPWGHKKQPYIFVVENSLELDNDSVQNMVTHVKFWFYPSLLPGNTMLSCCQHQMLVTPIKLLRD